MSRFSKIFVTLSMLCYIATSSIAAVHAFPMMGSSGSSQSVANLVTGNVEADIVNTLMPCHQMPGASEDSVKASNACKVFCSAIGHALLSLSPVDLVSTLRHTSPHSRTNRFLSALTSVDHQPPK